MFARIGTTFDTSTIVFARIGTTLDTSRLVFARIGTNLDTSRLVFARIGAALAAASPQVTSRAATVASRREARAVHEVRLAGRSGAE